MGKTAINIIVQRCVLLLIGISMNFEVIAGPVTGGFARQGSNELTVGDLHAATVQLPPPRLSELKTEPQARQILATDLLLRRTLAERARLAGADSIPRIAAQLRLANERLLSDLYLEHVEAPALDERKLEKLALDEYRAFPERYRKDERFARHILIGTHPSCQNDPKKTIEELQSKIRNGTSFEELAKAYSDDAVSAAKGGELGWIRRGQTVKPFEDALFAMQTAGEITTPVATKFGMHLIQLVEIKQGVLPPFDEVKQAAIELQRQKVRQEVRTKLLDELRDPAKLIIDSEALKIAIEAALAGESDSNQNK